VTIVTSVEDAVGVATRVGNHASMVESCGEVSSSGDRKIGGGRGGYGDLSWDSRERISDSLL
jgi:hypothetical protein